MESSANGVVDQGESSDGSDARRAARERSGRRVETIEADAPDPTPPGRIVVASVPSGHVYVRHLSPESGHQHAVVRLPDPAPDRPDRPAGAAWWPPVMLTPEWAEQAEFDVFHLHFGFDAADPAQLAELVDVLRRRGKPLVFTVHDLRNPHHATSETHDRQLDVLVPAADALITLTGGAAAEIERRWGRTATVLPHPHVVPLPTIAERAATPRRAGPFRVGLHVKSLRASMDPLRILPALVASVAELPDAVLQVNGHRDVLDGDGARHEPALAAYLHRAAERGELELAVHDYFSDRELWDYLGSLDVSVLPYRFGTHSGWLEACRDLGTAVVAPTCGYYADQGPVHSYVHEGERYDAASLATALRQAYDAGPVAPVLVDLRRSQRRRVAAAHEELYRRLVGATCASA